MSFFLARMLSGASTGDLKALAAAPRIEADPGAVQDLSRYIIFDGDVAMPVLTMHTTGDGLVANQDEQAYASVVRTAGTPRCCVTFLSTVPVTAPSPLQRP